MATRTELNELYSAAHKLKQVTKERDELRSKLAVLEESTEVLHIPAQWLDAPDGTLLDRLSLAAAGAMLDKGFSGLTRDDLAKCNCSNVGRKVVQVLANHARQKAAFHISQLPSHDSISTP